MRGLGFAGVLLVLGAGAARGQTIELRLREDSSRVPIAGAIVRLLRQNAPVAQALTDATGRAVLRGPDSGSYRIKVDRIGYYGMVTPALNLAAGETRRIELPMASLAMPLPTLVVEGKSRCDLKASQGVLATALWDEIRKALTANLITQGRRSVPLQVREFHRELTRSGKALREWVFKAALTRSPPFRSLPPAALARTGFVVFERDSTDFAAPDAALLLSDEFVNTHCFLAVAGADRLVGLAFEPSPGRKLPDVSGTLWVDRATSQLQFLEYRYTGLGGVLATPELGGRVEFSRLPSGDWIVGYWHIRMPWIEQGVTTGAGGVKLVVSRLVGFKDRGGRVAIATEQRGPPIDRSILRGTVYDSVAAMGLSGAVVTVPDRDSVRTDANGRFELVLAASGPQVVTVRHPKLGLLQEPTSRDVVLSLGDVVLVDFAVPPITAFVRELCGPVRDKSGLVGVIRGATGTPAAALDVRVQWQAPSGGVQEVRGRKRPNGLFALCNLPPDRALPVRLQQGSQVLGEWPLQLELRKFAWLELSPETPATPPPPVLLARRP